MGTLKKESMAVFTQLIIYRFLEGVAGKDQAAFA